MTHLQKALPVQLFHTHVSGTPNYVIIKQLTEPWKPPFQGSHPTFGVASGGQDGARRAEEVREVTGKTFHLLRCLPSGEERCVAGSTSALLPRRPSQRRTGEVREGKEAVMSAAVQGGYDSISPDLVELRSDRWGATPSCLSRTLGVRFCPDS